jgi:predicted nucleotidyltransferase
MKILCKIIAGSRLYGLETTESDIDIRGVFLNTDYQNILGLNKSEIIKENQQDSLFFEFLHFIRSLRKTNTQVIEILFSEVFEQSSEEFEEIRKNKFKLIDSKKLYSSLLGYIHNEKRLATGERTGYLGSKRKNQLERYGFSPKNFSHLLRLAYCGKVFFEDSIYPVNLENHNKNFRDFLFSIKTEPDKFTKEKLIQLCDQAVLDLNRAFDARKNNFVFDLDLANEFCLKFYYPFIRKSYQKQKENKDV